MAVKNTVKAEPTKDFFIQMLTKDIKLERAIIDLIDNSIDGAMSISKKGNFKDLCVRINIDKNQFVIKDNCGGFSLAVAKDYAFMFGRPSDSKNEIKNSVGRFGVGMKRALFKIGNKFEVESKCKKDHFQVDVDVNNWSHTNSGNANNWSFDFNLIKKETNDLGNKDGVFIKVESLNEDVAEEFSKDIFIAGLKDEIERTLSFAINKGLKIYLNNIELNKSNLGLLENKNLKPICLSFSLKNVSVKVYAGIGKPDMDAAGWYIYCNDRLVLEKDRTNLTGWNGKKFGESNVQKFHNIYAMFRGIVFFSAEDSKLLPMTTTKTGIDSNAAVYKAAKGEMIKAMSQVITFLKTFDSDVQREEIISLSTETDVTDIQSKTYQNKFLYPSLQKMGDDEQYTSVTFKAKKDNVNKAKTFFNVTKNPEVGHKVFEYFLKSESENL